MNLKPCPFCGSTKMLVYKRSYNNYIECTNCGAMGPDSIQEPYNMTQTAVKETAARDVWNKRYEEKK
jgi:Lar family restriction alleviation protein